jgi:ABC-2 type transport system ATP-binding protein
MVGLLGPNGAGKTTTIKCILGLVRPDSGEIRVGGVDCRRRCNEALRNMAAVLEGARNTYWRLTAWENMVYFAGIHGVSERAGREYFEYLLDVLKLREKRNTEVRNLSSGYKQKVAVACALAKRTPLVFLDEPTLGLDVESSYELREALRKLQTDERRTIVVSSHDMHVVQDVCSRAIIVSQGRIVADEAIPALIAVFSTRKYKVAIADGSDPEASALVEDSVTAAFPRASVTRAGAVIEVTVSLRDASEIYLLVETLRDSGARINAITQEEIDLEKAFLEIVRRDNSLCG